MRTVICLLCLLVRAGAQVVYRAYTNDDCSGTPVITMGGPAGCCMKYGVEQNIFTANTQHDTGLHMEISCLGSVKVYQKLVNYQQMPIFRKDAVCKAQSAKLSDTYQPCSSKLPILTIPAAFSPTLPNKVSGGYCNTPSIMQSQGLAKHCEDKTLCESVKSEFFSCDVSDICGVPCRNPATGDTDLCPAVGCGSTKCGFSNFARTCLPDPVFEKINGAPRGASASAWVTGAAAIVASALLLRPPAN